MKKAKHRIHNYGPETQRTMLIDICNRIYVARNISLSQDDVLKELENIDCLFGDGGYNEEDD